MFVGDNRTSLAEGVRVRPGVGNEVMDAALTGVLRIKAVFRAHFGDERKILAASDQPDDG